MPDTDTSRESTILSEPHTDSDRHHASRRRLVTWRSILVTFGLLAIVLMAILPPLLNMNRFKHRIVTSISTSLGRPVHLDSVSLVLLPLPGFKLENFVVAEDPAFGTEPVIRANSVLATLRISSLWRRRVEFSRISLLEPSINLVHLPSQDPSAEGRWNVEGILMQAARIPAAPTAQAKPSAAPRFPYIEATDARVNFKSGVEKLPFSLTEADFALWLPNPQQWRIRVEAKPSRTDTNASDTGTVSLEGTLGHAERFDQIPLELSVEWKNAPLGEASRVLTGRDAGLRGNLRLGLSASGTIGTSMVKSTFDLRSARRADFVPDHLLDLHAECQAVSAETFHAFHQVRCAWPPPLAPTLVAVTGDVPDIRQPGSASFEVGTPALPAETLLDWLRIGSPRVPPGVSATGTLAGSITISDVPVAGRLDLMNASLSGGPLGTSAVEFGTLTIASTSLLPTHQPGAQRRKYAPTQGAPVPDGSFLLAPTTLALGAKDPATLDGRFGPSGLSLHLEGNVLLSRLTALAAAVPQFGDGLDAVLPSPVSSSAVQPVKDLRAEPIVHIDLVSNRPWLGPQTWSLQTRSKTPNPTPLRSARHHH